MFIPCYLATCSPHEDYKILYSSLDDSHCCVDLVGVSPAWSNWRDIASALPFFEGSKQDKHSATWKSSVLDFISIGLSTFGSISRAAEEFVIFSVIQFSRMNPRVGGACLGDPSALLFVRRIVPQQFIGLQLSVYSW